ncbi:hypothetical protein [Candidatus Palauibacter sp.]|uniref:hypothetical protein n=1 Tax=Candidatus Palauibacter sp. TaxID=3101350 RepID=UPI003CC5252B
MIDAYEADRDRLGIAAPELLGLTLQVAYYPIDLLDHGLRQDLDLDTDLDRGKTTSGHIKPRVLDCRLAGDDGSKRSVAPAVLHPVGSVR